MYLWCIRKKVCSKDKSLCHFTCGDEDVDDNRRNALNINCKKAFPLDQHFSGQVIEIEPKRRSRRP